MTPFLSVAPRRLRWLRFAVVAIVTWLVGSVLFAPWLNPFITRPTASDVTTHVLLQMSEHEMMFAREDVESFYARHREWPEYLEVSNDNPTMTFDLPTRLVLRGTFTSRYPAESGLAGTRVELRFDPTVKQWHCQAAQPAPPPGRLPRGCEPPPAAPWSIVDFLGTLLMGSAVVLAVLAAATALVLLLGNPEINQLRKQPRKLRRHPVQDLVRLDRQLRWRRQRTSLLVAAEVAAEDWHEAVAYAAADAHARAQLLALRLSARSSASLGWSLPGVVYEWQLPSTLPVALERLLLYVPAPGLPARDLVRHLRGLPTGQDVMLVVSPDRASDAALNAFASDPANLCAALDQATQTEWLLHPAPPDVLVALLARQLRVTRISPYQTRGGVTRPSVFFGREQLLARVLNREPGNYLLVGGRQLGKTSLMKAIERRFVDHPHVHCHYLSLRDHRLAARLAAELSLPADTPIEALVAVLADRAGGRRLLLLIDETDLFLRDEARSGYLQLAALRSLSEEGHCHFMLAGFWDLYEAITLDYASPIRNFGEVINLGALEHDACIALATEPLSRLGIAFAEPALVERMVTACGNRANLVAILCQHGLEQLERGERVLGAAHVRAAMASDALHDALAGWARLSPDPQACVLDRVIVYRLAQLRGQGDEAEATLTMSQLLQEFGEAGIAVGAEATRRAFARLQLAYVLKREGDGYDFAVPLFARQFHAGEVDALLQREVESLRVA